MPIADGFLSKKITPTYAPEQSVYHLKETTASEELADALKSEMIVPLARTKKDGGVIEAICYAVPTDLLSSRASKSRSVFQWRRFRRNPREGAEAARILHRALEINGLKDRAGNSVEFYIVPNDEEPLFTDLEEDREEATLQVRRNQAEDIARLANAVETLNDLLRAVINQNRSQR